MSNSKQTLIILKSDGLEEPKTDVFANYLVNQLKLDTKTITFRFPKYYIPLHHTYPTSIQKKNALLLKEEISKSLESADCVMLLFAYSRNSSWQKNRISDILMACRDLRIPYIGFPEDGSIFKGLNKIALPIGFLVEEKEKAPVSNVFCEYCNSELELIQPNDKGKRASRNVDFITKILHNYKRNPKIIKGEKSSFKIELEAVDLLEERNYDIIFISASREYSLDDILFRPKESTVLWKSDIPILIINPRDDIYVLCGN